MGRPMGKVAAIFFRTDNFLKVLVDEQKLCEVVEHFIVASKGSVVSVMKEEFIGNAVDRSHQDIRKISFVTQLLGSERKPVAQFECRFLRERAEKNL